MPKFNFNLPMTQNDIKSARMRRITLPKGLIGENNKFAYGYDGTNYYVTEGILNHLVTRVSLSFDEAKQLFDALTFSDVSEPCPKIISFLVKSARKQKISGDELFWHFENGLIN